MTGYVMSKRKLTTLVEEGYVNGWDDPRLPTIEGLRRRGYTPEGINSFCEKIGITRASNLISQSLLQDCVRADLDKKAPRAMAVLNPLKVTITNAPQEIKLLEVPDFPNQPNSPTHTVAFSPVIYIEREDFDENSPKGYFRLTPDQPVGLKYFSDSILSFSKAIKNENGEILEIEAELVKKEKVKSHIHWVGSENLGMEPCKITVNLYDNLFTVEDLSTVENFLDAINPNSLKVIQAFVDHSVKKISGDHVQFERLGFFCKDFTFTEANPIWNSTVTLKQDKAKK